MYREEYNEKNTMRSDVPMSQATFPAISFESNLSKRYGISYIKTKDPLDPYRVRSKYVCNDLSIINKIKEVLDNKDRLLFWFHINDPNERGCYMDVAYYEEKDKQLMIYIERSDELTARWVNITSFITQGGYNACIKHKTWIGGGEYLLSTIWGFLEIPRNHILYNIKDVSFLDLPWGTIFVCEDKNERLLNIEPKIEPYKRPYFVMSWWGHDGDYIKSINKLAEKLVPTILRKRYCLPSKIT